MKKQATTTPATPATTKNFCGQISTELAAQIDSLAAKYNLTNKPQIIAFLFEQTLQNIQKADTPSQLRAENISYYLECYIQYALTKDEQISKQAAQNFVADKLGNEYKRLNIKSTENILSYYISEIKAHATKYAYTENSRFVALLNALEATKESREK
jgi:hypothetical protein